MSYENHPRGRPRVPEQIEYDVRIRPYYLATISIERTAELVKLNRHTVRKRYHKWDAEGLQKLNAELNRGDSKFQLEFLNLNQSLIDNLNSSLRSVDNDIDTAHANGTDSLPRLYAVKTQIALALESLNGKRLAVKIYPGAVNIIDKELKARIQKND